MCRRLLFHRHGLCMKQHRSSAPAYFWYWFLSRWFEPWLITVSEFIAHNICLTLGVAATKWRHSTDIISILGQAILCLRPPIRSNLNIFNHQGAEPSLAATINDELPGSYHIDGHSSPMPGYDALHDVCRCCNNALKQNHFDGFINLPAGSIIIMPKCLGFLHFLWRDAD